MAYSIGEQVIQAMQTALGSSIAGASVYRSRITGFAKNALPAVNIVQVGGPADQPVIPKVQWKKTVQVQIFTCGDQPDQLADPIRVAVNQALMVDESLGGLALQIMPVAEHFMFSDADGTICVLTIEYDVQYRTDQVDMTVQ